MRAFPVMLLAVGLVASLSSCATEPFSDACQSSVTAGDASSAVTVTGAFASAPTVKIPTPIVANRVERSELLPGTGHILATGDVAVIKYTIVNGDTGEVVGQDGYTTKGLILTLGATSAPALDRGLVCAQVGSRVAITSTAKQAGQDPAKFPNSFVFVIDIMKAFPAKAYGMPQSPQAGMPSVVTAPNGAPGITILKTPPPSNLKINVLQEASGAIVKAGDQVVVKYTGVLWDDSSVFDSTWIDDAGKARIVTLTSSATVTKAFVKGLVGQHVGSQVLIVAPPKDAFDDKGSAGIPPGSTLVYVVDILGVVH